jgi:hypothetical protein
MMRLLRVSVLWLSAAAVFALIAGVGATAASAQTPAPWWGVSSAARPTNLLGKDEVQRLTVSATKGDYLLIELQSFQIAVVPFDATAAELQEKLQTIYSPRPVQVSEEPSPEEDARAYRITFPDQAVEPIFARADNEGLAESFGGEPLEGAKAEVNVSELDKGASSEVVVSAQNLGNAPTSGQVSVADQLPAGLQAVHIEAHAGGTAFFDRGPVECSLSTLTCSFSGSLPPFEVIEVRIGVVAKEGAKGGELNTATASGGGAQKAASASHPLALGAPRAFGIDDYQLIPEEAGGALDTQAGSHPFQLTSDVTLASQTADSLGLPRTVALPKDVISELPPGLVGNPTPFAQCTDTQFSEVPPIETGGPIINDCPPQAAIGVATVTFNSPALGLDTATAPIFNMTPRPGEPARFGFKALGIVSAFLDTSVRTGGDYGVTVSSTNITQAAWLLSVRLTFWGVPGDHRHDGQRGWECLQGFGSCSPSTASSPPPFLAMPTSCGPFATTLRADSWAASGKPSEAAEAFTYALPQAIDGCNHLPFSPSIQVTPDGAAASTPTGLDVDVHVPQDGVLNAEGLAESAVKAISVTLPEGLSLNPAAADGLQACSLAQIALSTNAEASCPDASKIGKVAIHSPLLPNPLEGFVYLASPQNFSGPPQENPFESLVAIYVVAKDRVSGVLVKLAGRVSLSPTGQILTTFDNNPQLPFEDAKIEFFGGDRAPLATPRSCGVYLTSASFSPWSGNAPASSPSSSFQITTGPNGGPCPNPPPFAPSLTSGTTNINAGSFSALTTTITREDGNQDIRSVQLHYPPGLSGLLSSVKLCPEAQANEGTCGPESLIGETIVSVGLGGDPFSVTGGKVYITEKYKGAPFGLSIVNPASAGPFVLQQGRPVVVRAKVEVDPHTAALTVTTDESGPHAIPSIIEGIPLQIKHVNVTVDRPRFTFNPTNCKPLAITGSIASVQGASSPVAVSFQATNCAILKFKPAFKVSTAGRTSRANGASLSVKLTYPKAPFGSQANIAKVKVDLPRQLPSRLTTLQKACPAATFQANHANCPAASIVGHAKVITPLLPVPLEGPAYFVSYGGEAFPSLTMVLQGYGVTVELVGSTFIKNGITSSTFKSTPDVPFDSFELTLPQGRYSALAANSDLCRASKLQTVRRRFTLHRNGRAIHVQRSVKRRVAQPLLMPTEFVAQNGAVLRQSTKISVSGCQKTLHRKKAKRRSTGRHR